VVHAERQCRLQRLQRVVAAIGIARIVGLAHPANEVPRAAAITDRSGKTEEQQITAWDKGVRQTALRKRNRGFTGQRRIAELAQHTEIDDMVVAELLTPPGEFAAQSLEYCGSALELDTMALPVIEADRLNRGKMFERPGETGRRILTSGKQDQPLLGDRVGRREPILGHVDEIEFRMAAINKPAPPWRHPLL
jgi:hypothetical protein